MSTLEPKRTDEDSIRLLLRRIMLIDGLLLLVLTVASVFLHSRLFAYSALSGGILAFGSFWLLKTDIQSMMHRLSAHPEDSMERAGPERVRFFFKFYARLSVVALLLFALAAKVPIDPLGLLLGLGTMMVSVVIIGLSMGKNQRPSKV